MKTDLESLKICRFEMFQIAPLARIQMNVCPATAPFEPLAFAGREFSCVAILRSRMPVKDLRLRIAGIEGAAYPVMETLFPEQATLLPDLIDSDNDTVSVGGNRTLLFLLRFRLTSDIAPGRRHVIVIAESATHRCEERYFDMNILPAHPGVTTAKRTNFWLHWETFCNHLNLELWSEPFWAMAEKYLRELADGGLNVVTTSLCHDPFRYPLPLEYAMFNRFPEMIRWEKNALGRWIFDYSIFDRYVELNFKLGIDKEIECHSFLPCKEQEPQLCWFESGDRMHKEYHFEDHEYLDAWRIFLQDFYAHCQERNWAHLLSICPYDEPADIDRFRKAAEIIRQAMPGIKISAAVAAQKAMELYDVLDIATIHLEAGYTQESHSCLQISGVSLRWYNCCAPFWGNTLLGCELSEAYRIAWITENGHFDGFLRWSAINWPDFLPDDPGFNWPSGDTFLLYPGQDGPRESLRWHTYKQGIRDVQLCSEYLNSPAISQFIQQTGHFGLAKIDSSPGELQQQLYRILSSKME